MSRSSPRYQRAEAVPSAFEWRVAQRETVVTKALARASVLFFRAKCGAFAEARSRTEGYLGGWRVLKKNSRGPSHSVDGSAHRSFPSMSILCDPVGARDALPAGDTTGDA
jgi:hypothetical protein